MKAAVWYGKKDVRVENVPEPPAPGPGQVKVKVHWCGICGSDLHEYDAGPIFIPAEAPHPLTGVQAPLILGHEFSGEVVEIGEGVQNIQVGERITADACQYCGKCYMCKRNRYSVCSSLAFTGLMANGAFADYVNVPAYTIYRLPPEMPSDVGAVVEPAAVGVHAIRRGRVLEGDTVAVVGAGTIGLVTLQAAKAAGASKVIVLEMAQARKEYAKKLGATAVIDPSEQDAIKAVRQLTDGLGVDVAIECVGGSETGALAVDLTRQGGKTVLVGIFEKPSEIHFNNLVFFEKEIVGSLAYYGEFSTAIALMADGRIAAQPMITAKIKLDDIVEKGFKELLANREQHIKILVSPQ
ncbi:2,3-butanediol dehydrogenase [Desulfomonile tiedjei]|uniref:Theronine dehydrogenase-like Zn-dependent dehydrogenase n=1 Tax=Desulfomonile tiedjei (strain ATCC 49306 / DSM 6799 / DCB-1) TaxID=706587 RepID=I4C1N2_DESTA|nr:2,3-butanediol dehydrogenase [Desulfomonile tiedjei]AFM23473.1 theronine dehydrogenase-like Zn-dependent dehydrogenase [Desulfomonile tiedjei DSM 6799]